MRCGPVTLAHIAKDHLGLSITDAQADAFCCLDPQDGTSTAGMANGLEKLGLINVHIHTDMHRAGLRAALQNGAIVTVCYVDGGKFDGHWMCLEEVDHETIHVYDPDCGYLDIPWRFFDQHWLDFEREPDGFYRLVDRCAVIGYKSVDIEGQ